MNPQLYSRYVPKKKVSGHSSITNGATGTSSLPLSNQIDQRPTTNPDASASYARYIPPSSKPKLQIAAAEAAGPILAQESSKRKREIDTAIVEPARSKKSRKGDKRSTAIAIPPAAAPNPPTQDISKKKKKKSRGEEPKEVVEPLNQDGSLTKDDESCHKSLLAKREKSLKKAEKLARKATQKAVELAEAGKDENPEKSEPPELHALEPLPQPEPVPESVLKPTFSALPPWLASPIRVSATATSPFVELGIPNEVIENLKLKGFKRAFAVQAAVLPLLIPGNRRQQGDVLVSAATGSGKTLAYVLPMVDDISQSIITRLRGLVIMPTRELVNQVREVCEICSTAFATSSRRRVNIGTAVGNQPLKSEQASLMNDEQVYDPDEAKRRERRINAKWESSSQETDEEDFSLYEETASTLPGHVNRFTPKVDILVCTPGRLVEHLESTPGFTLNFLKWLVIDEADKLLDQSFQQWLEVLMSSLAMGQKPVGIQSSIRRSYPNITKIVLSATVTREVGQLNALKLHRPRLVVLEGSEEPSIGATYIKSDREFSLPGSLQESAVKVKNESEKPLYLMELLDANGILGQAAAPSLSDSFKDSSSSSSEDDNLSEVESSTSEASSVASDASAVNENHTQRRPAKPLNAPRGVLIFTKSNETAVRLSRLLTLMEPSFSGVIATLTSTVRNSIRRASLRDFQRGKLSILVASDLVSRGLDIPNLAHVINYDIPTSLTSYIHRVGRTARAGRLGHAWTLFTNTEGRWFWNEIARSELVQRSAGKVERLNIDAASFGEKRQRYEAALTALGKEANEPSSEKSRSRM